MLEFAYTGEVNVAQELLPSLLHTARSFRIKGLDKVENPVEPAPRVSPGPLSYPVRAPSLVRLPFYLDFMYTEKTRNNLFFYY